MSRINIVTDQTANADQKALFDAIQGQLGMVPNFLRVLGNSPVALKSFLGLYGVAGAGSLDPLTRERIALAVAEQNACEYCVSAHTAIGAQAGLSSDEMQANRAGTSQNAKAAAAVKFARALVEHKGGVSSEEITDVRKAGYSDADLAEIIMHVGMNLITNILGKASRVDIDFPHVKLNAAA